MKYVALVLVGLFIGVLGTVTGINAMKQGTPYDAAVMTVLSQQMGGLRGMREKGACSAENISRRLDIMQAMAGETNAAFLPVGDDDQFKELTQDMSNAIAKAQAAAPTNCDELGQAMSGIGGTCKACHDLYR